MNLPKENIEDSNIFMVFKTENNECVCIISNDNNYYFAKKNGTIVLLNKNKLTREDKTLTWIQLIDDGLTDGTFYKIRIGKRDKISALAAMSESKKQIISRT